MKSLTKYDDHERTPRKLGWAKSARSAGAGLKSRAISGIASGEQPTTPNT